MFDMENHGYSYQSILSVLFENEKDCPVMPIQLVPLKPFEEPNLSFAQSLVDLSRNSPLNIF